MRQTTSLVKLTTALVGIASVALAAAVLETQLDGPSGGGVGISGGSMEPASPTGGVVGLPLVLEILVLATAIVLGIPCALYLLANGREMLKTIVGLLAGIAVLLLVLLTVSWVLGADGALPPQGNEAGVGDGAGGEGGGSGGQYLGVVIYVLGGFVGTWFVIFSLFLLYTRSSSPAVDASAPEPDVRVLGGTTAELADAAGRAADRIAEGDGATLNNEIYRAWREMTELLDVDRPASSTPGEFADAAVDAGFDAAYVEELTGLFEAARYGGVEPTPDRERRAVDVLRRIEHAYGTESARDEVGDG